MTSNDGPASNPDHGTAGWHSSFPRFSEVAPRVVRTSLEWFVESVSLSQLRAWDLSIPKIQREVREISEADQEAPSYTAILEYQLPLEGRRTDVIFLAAGAIFVIELKGKPGPEQADLDQTSAYARDLRAYHRDCQGRPVHAVLVPMLSDAPPYQADDVWVSSPRALDSLIKGLATGEEVGTVSAGSFLEPEAYRPLPTLVQAARELFESREVREVWRARAATDPAVSTIARIAHEAARTKTRHLVLITGVPGSGKTLVGMRIVHSRFLDDLAVPRAAGKPPAPALFLSGNGPLVLVLQYILSPAGGGGRTFVRHIKDYLEAHVPRPQRVPAEHLLVFDEAQRAFTPDRVREIHPKWSRDMVQSEPQLFVNLCKRIPEWSVLVGLIGTGQEIHLGEEGGLVQWRHAVENCGQPGQWTVHAPAEVEEVFAGSKIKTSWEMSLNLNTELRFHLAAELHDFVSDLLHDGRSRDGTSVVRERPEPYEPTGLTGLRLWVTRNIEQAKQYLRGRYAEQPLARFGLLASSRDKILLSHGVDNSFQATQRMKLGPWYSDGEESPLSCRRLDKCVTEFGAQGLELDMALLAWGSDFIREDDRWTDAHARKYRRGPVELKDPYLLRKNAYRVLLTRGRDGTLVFVPDEHVLDETWEYLMQKGFRKLV